MAYLYIYIYIYIYFKYLYVSAQFLMIFIVRCEKGYAILLHGSCSGVSNGYYAQSLPPNSFLLAVCCDAKQAMLKHVIKWASWVHLSISFLLLESKNMNCIEWFQFYSNICYAISRHKKNIWNYLFMNISYIQL